MKPIRLSRAMTIPESCPPPFISMLNFSCLDEHPVVGRCSEKAEELRRHREIILRVLVR